MNIASEKVAESVGTINETGELLKKILQYASLSDDETSKIAAAIEQQSNTIEEISQSTEDSAKVSKDIFESSQGLFEKTYTLSQAVDGLEGEIGKFRLPNDTAMEIENARVTHKNWVGRLYRMYYTGEKITPEEIKDHTQCKFGKWYYSRVEKEFADKKEFVAIESPHKLLHEKAKAAVEAYQRGGKLHCLRLIEEVDRISEEIVEHLDRLLGEIRGEIGSESPSERAPALVE